MGGSTVARFKMLKRLNDLRIRTRVAGGFGIAAALVGALAFVSFDTFQSTRRAAADVNSSSDASFTADDVLLAQQALAVSTQELLLAQSGAEIDASAARFRDAFQQGLTALD